ncbi:MAG: hypothetical protein M3R46_13970 [Actinomycetota bacterium]|nr:hypothetical protein [Thermoleophilaceae bacterium]MDQ3092732.1 hypothetical protein [Actinomycetota bacterium]
MTSSSRGANAAVAVGLFAATGAVYAPLHGELARAFAPDRIRALVRLNWLRTAGGPSRSSSRPRWRRADRSYRGG